MKFFRKYGLTCTTALLILYLSIMTPSQEAEKLLLFEGQDKVVHFAMYAFLALVVCRDFYRQKVRLSSLRMYVAAIVCPIIFGGAIELLQENFFPPRTGDWWDWLVDVLGAGCGYIAARLLAARLR